MNHLKLLALNKSKGSFKVEAQANEAESTIYLYDMIVGTDDEAQYMGGISPQAFIKALNGVTSPTIHLRVNSPGGSVFAARAIEQAIREHKSTIIAHVDGVAASAASFLIMAADKVVMSPGSFLMIHKAWTFAYGNADDMLQTASLLEQIDASLIKTYAAKSGQSEADINEWMADETWLDAEKAKSLGFIDEVADSVKAKASTNWDLSAYKNAPKIQAEQNDQQPQYDMQALRRAALKAAIPPA